MTFKEQTTRIISNSFNQRDAIAQIVAAHANDRARLIDQIMDGLDRSCRDYTRLACFLSEQKTQSLKLLSNEKSK